MIYRRQSGNFQFEEDPLSQSTLGIAFIVHDALFFNEIFSNETIDF